MNDRKAWLVLLVLTVPLRAAALEEVKGTATYLQRIVLPTQAVFEARVEDVSKADAPAEVIGSVSIEGPGNPPIAFSIGIDPERIKEDHSYSVRATITVDGKLYFTTDQAYPVLTRGHGSEVHLTLHRANAQKSAAVVPDVSVLGQLPASYTGVLPCADCRGIRYRLDLFPDQSFFLNTTYLGKGNEAGVDDLGRWTLSSDRRNIVLKGGKGAPLAFRVVTSRTFRLLDPSGREIKSSLNYSLDRSEKFDPVELRLAVRGMYRYLADAGTFTECLTGQRWPVAQAGDNATVEREYGKARREPGEEVMLSVEGRVSMRPRTEGEGFRPTLLVERFVRFSPGESCGATHVAKTLEGTNWKLTHLGGKPVVVKGAQREPNLVLDSEKRSLAGSGGCNRIAGKYEIIDQRIGFGTIASTKMACPDGMDTEQAFIEMLSQVRVWKVLGKTLELYDGQGKQLARFEASPRE
jgi:uncharacterized lipoprotein YbaY/heat shock protein HslJ